MHPIKKLIHFKSAVVKSFSGNTVVAFPIMRESAKARQDAGEPAVEEMIGSESYEGLVKFADDKTINALKENLIDKKFEFFEKDECIFMRVL